MKFVIDTSAYINGAKGDPAIGSLFAQADMMLMPAIVYGELVFGYRKGNRISQNITKLHKFLSEERVQLVPVDAAIAESYGQLRATQERAGKNLAPNDLWIAATCIYVQLPLLSTDSDFRCVEGLGLVLA